MASTTMTLTMGPGMLTDSIYRASLDPARRALIVGAESGTFRGIPYAWLKDKTWVGYSDASDTFADSQLAQAQLSGLPIDMDLMMRNWPAWTIMQVRQNNGYRWVPPYGQADVNVAPGLSMPFEQSNYPAAAMPPGWIPVSTDAKDYPPFASPAVPAPPVVYVVNLSEMLSAVDPSTGTTHYYFAPVAGQNPPLGTKIQFNGLNFQAAYYPVNFVIGGPTKMWMLVSA